jgi:hypothetical protein
MEFVEPLLDFKQETTVMSSNPPGSRSIRATTHGKTSPARRSSEKLEEWREISSADNRCVFKSEEQE